jgi:hypothetical protein
LVSQLGPSRWQSKEQIIDSCARPLKVQASLLLFTEFGNHLIHNFHLKGSGRRVPKPELHDRGHCHPKRGKISGHLSVAEGSDLHPLQQVIPHAWRTDNGKAQLRAPGLQKGELVKQAMRILLGHFLSPVHLYKITFEKGDLPDKAFYLLTSRD